VQSSKAFQVLNASIGLMSLVSLSACNLNSLIKRPGQAVSQEAQITDVRQRLTLSASAQSIAEHGSAGVLALPISSDGSFVDSRRSFRVRVQLHSSVDLNQVSERNVSIEAIGTDSADSASVEVVGDTIEISHEGFFGMKGEDVAARFCVRINGLVDLQGHEYQEHRIQLSRNLGDIDGNGISREQADYDALQPLFLSELSSSSAASMIRSDLSQDGGIDIFDYSLFVAHEQKSVPTASAGFCN
jgi:hypothetical protein